MSEHKSNPQAISAAMFPPLLPAGVVAGVHFDIQVDAQSNVLVLPPERIRRIMMDGFVEEQTEIFCRRSPPPEEVDYEDAPGEYFTEEVWRAPPHGAYVHELGKPLPPEHCDVVVILGTVAQDTLDKPILAPGGAQPQPRVSMQLHRVIARMPLVDWQRQHMAQLRGVQS